MNDKGGSVGYKWMLLPLPHRCRHGPCDTNAHRSSLSLSRSFTLSHSVVLLAHLFGS